MYVRMYVCMYVCKPLWKNVHVRNHSLQVPIWDQRTDRYQQIVNELMSRNQNHRFLRRAFFIVRGDDSIDRSLLLFGIWLYRNYQHHQHPNQYLVLPPPPLPQRFEAVVQRCSSDTSPSGSGWLSSLASEKNNALIDAAASATEVLLLFFFSS